MLWNESGDKYYKVKVNYITIDEKTSTEKKSAYYILVQASNFEEALKNFNNGMHGSMLDYEIEIIAETKIVDVYKYQVADEGQNATKDIMEKVASDKGVQRAVKKFRDTVPDGTKVSAKVQGSDGTELVPETVIVDKSKPKNHDD